MTSERKVVFSRGGQVLGKGTILKLDQYPKQQAINRKEVRRFCTLRVQHPLADARSF